jgi:hypothetical protein
MKKRPTIDRVVIKAGSQRREFSVAEFHRLPLSLRIRCVLMQTATFYCEGREIDRAEALDRIREEAADDEDDAPFSRTA